MRGSVHACSLTDAAAAAAAAACIDYSAVLLSHVVVMM